MCALWHWENCWQKLSKWMTNSHKFSLVNQLRAKEQHLKLSTHQNKWSYYTWNHAKRTESYISNVVGNSSVSALQFPGWFLVAEENLWRLLVLPSTFLEFLSPSQCNTQSNGYRDMPTMFPGPYRTTKSKIPGFSRTKKLCRYYW